jgi:peptidoglycan-associated lipoprotein
MIMASGCAPKKTKTETETTAPVMESDISGGSADSDSGKAMGLQTVHFAFDSSTLDGEAKAVLKSNAAIMKDKTSLKVQIEGHTDERGGIQYNVALGERRANSARSYMIDQGVPADRLTTVSYGKEKPIAQGHDESAWAQNRRANFRITEK